MNNIDEDSENNYSREPKKKKIRRVAADILKEF